MTASDKAKAAVTSVVNKVMGMSAKYNFVDFATPCTDGAVITLPNPPADASNEDCERYVRSTIASGLHECLHLKHTDFDVTRQQAEGRFWFQLLNAVEDARINRIGKETVVSFAFWRRRLNDLLSTFPWRQTPQQVSLVDSLTHSVFFRSCQLLDVTFLSQEQQAREESYVADHEARFPKELIAESRKILSEKLPKAASTAHAAVIASDLLALLKRTCEADVDLGSKLERHLAQAQADCDEVMQAVVEKLDCGEGEGSGSGSRSGSGFSGKLSKKPESGSKEVSDNRQPELREQKLTEDVLKESPIPLSPEYRREWKKQCNEQLAPLRRQMRKIFSVKAENDDSYELATEGRDLVGMLDWASTRSTRIYARAAKSRQLDAEVCVILDRSGSMGIVTMSTAKLATFALCESIDKLRGCSSEVLAFPGMKDNHVGICKTRNDSLSKVRSMFEGLNAYGATPFQEAFAIGLQHLKASSKKLKLAVMITDGRVNAQFAQTTREAYAKEGIEIAVLSIGIDNQDAFPTNYKFVLKADQIIAALCELLSQTNFRKALVNS